MSYQVARGGRRGTRKVPYRAPIIRLVTLYSLLATVLIGCATTPVPEIASAPPVYPPPPDEPRFIFERTLRYSSNVEPPRAGAWLKRFATGEGEEIKGLMKPYDVTSRRGRIYVTDTVQNCVVMFDIAGGRYRQFGQDKPAELSAPTGIAISPAGEIYVADTALRRVAIFDAEGNFLRTLGDPARLHRPADVALSPDGQRAYVIDTGGVDTDAHQIFVYDTTNGSLLRNIGTRGTKPGQFNLPLQIATARDGTVYVVDKGNFRVQAFDADGHFLRSFGTLGRFPGQFFSPKGIATDRDGNVYVVDTAFGNVQIFDAKGQLLMVMGERASSSGAGHYMLPAGIHVDDDGRVYIVDQFFRKVDIFRPVATAPATAR